MFSHVWEMEGLKKNGESVFHGFQVGVGTIASVKLMEYVLQHSWAELESIAVKPLSLAERTAEIDMLLCKGCYGDAVRKTALEKYLDIAETNVRRRLFADVWSTLQRRMSERFVPAAKLAEMLKAAGAPVTPEEIGLSRQQFIHGIKTAQLIRKRYTILDLLYEAGVLDEAVNIL